MVMVIYMVYGMVASDMEMSKMAGLSDRRFVFEGSSGLKRETVILFLISW